MVKISIGQTIKLLKDTCFTPTTTFHEEQVFWKIKKFAEKNDFPFFSDRYGNIILKYTYPEGKKNFSSLAFVAHTDHPGFEITGVENRLYKAKWFGRVYPKYFNRTKVMIYTAKKPIHGEIVDFTTKPNDNTKVDTISIRSLSNIAQPGDFGMFDLTPFRINNDYASARAMDDLAGVAALLGTLSLLKENKVETEAYFVFTRAEEIGFVGAINLLKGNLLDKHTTLISIETSSKRPNVLLGDGPVIRIGDKATIFDTEVTKRIEAIAAQAKKKNKYFKYQLAYMDGGTCEASMFKKFGFKTGGLAFSLANYHNMGHGRKVALESISLKDMINMQALMFDMASLWEEMESYKHEESELFTNMVENAMSHKDKLITTKPAPEPLKIPKESENDNDTQEVM